MLANLSIVPVPVDADLAERAAEVRAQTNPKLPDAYALATAMHREHRGRTDVRLASFDKEVREAHAALRA
jgi:predicted nucleic acid-binding protein